MKNSKRTMYKQLPDGGNNITGAKIREIRQLKNITQKQLAEGLEQYGLQMNQKQVSAIEVGERQIVDYELDVFAKYLGVSIPTLYEPAEPAKKRIITEKNKRQARKMVFDCELVCMNLAPIMQQQRLSINAVTKKSGISRCTVVRIMRCKGMVRENTVKKVADGLGIDYSELIKKPSAEPAK